MARMLQKAYAERDIADIELYVRDTVDRISPYLASDEQEQLVARGVVLVRRLACALPPEQSLAEALQDRLGNALAVYRWRGARVRLEGAQLASSRAA
jgi:hypothetical protein